jgi:RNA polymerase sigma-70 factor, ECF subfamily
VFDGGDETGECGGLPGSVLRWEGYGPLEWVGRRGLTKRERFEETVLPHLDSAHNLARWILRDERDAEDVTQEACLRAYQFFEGFRGGNAKAWLLAIVRNTTSTWLEKNRGVKLTPFEEEVHGTLDEHRSSGDATGPEAALLQSADREMLQRALEELPPAYREALVLRELEGLSYKEISAVAEVPLGTVMSRLARGRTLLRQRLVERVAGKAAR